MKKNQSVFKLLLTGAFFLVLFGCKKGIMENQADPLSKENQGGKVTTLNVPTDIYVAGSLNGQAVYWKNGSVVTLPGGEIATGIVVSGTDVHVCGNGVSPVTGELVAKYWLNGVATDLTDGLSECRATGIGISGTDVIIAGYEGRYVRTACYWRNTVRTNMAGGSLPGQVFVATNGDFYIADLNSHYYWKNGLVQPALQLPAGATSANVGAVKEYNGTVYAVGERVSGGTSVPLFWINGVLQVGYLGNPNGHADAQDIVVSATGQRYFAGVAGPVWGNTRIVFWNTLGQADYWSPYTSYSGPSMALFGDDVFVCGSVNYPGTSERAVYWQNSGGDPVYLNDGSTPATATDIEVY